MNRRFGPGLLVLTIATFLSTAAWSKGEDQGSSMRAANPKGQMERTQAIERNYDNEVKKSASARWQESYRPRLTAGEKSFSGSKRVEPRL
jgi:hypothetical protein